MKQKIKRQVSPIKPWHRMGISKKQYLKSSPWKKANMSREKYENILMGLSQDLLSECRAQSEAEAFMEQIFGKDMSANL